MEAATGGGIGWAGEEGSQILAGQGVPAPSCPLTCPPASYSPAPPPGDVEKQLLAPREPLLLFPLAGRLAHAPGRGFAARLLRGPAGRQVHGPQPWRGWGWGVLPVSRSTASGLVCLLSPVPTWGDRELSPAVRAWVKWESARPAAVRSRREWGGQCGALGWLGCRAPPPRAGQDPQDTLPSHCQPRGGAGERLRALPPAAPQPHPHWAARPAEASGGRTETTGRHWPNPG